MSAGNIPPFQLVYGPATATSPGILTASGTQQIGGNKTFTGKVVTPASTTTQAGFNIGDPGVAPTSPVAGDMWMTAAHALIIRQNTVSQQIAVLAATQTWTATQTFSAVAMNGPLQLKSYTVATLPASPAAGQAAWASDAAGNGPCLALGNGSVWKRCDNTATTVA